MQRKVMLGKELIQRVCEAYQVNPETVQAVKIEGDFQGIVHVTFTHTLPNELAAKTLPLAKPEDDDGKH